MYETPEHAEPSLAGTWLRALRRSLLWVVLLTVLGAGLGVLFGAVQAKSYQATSQLVLLPVNGKDPSEVNSTAGVAQSMASSYAAAVTSDSVLDAALASAGVDETPAEAARSITVTVPSGTVVMDVVVEQRDAAKAAALANAISQQFVQQAPQLMPQVGTSTMILKPTVLRTAEVPTTPSSLGSRTYGIVGAFLGLAAGMALALWRQRD